MLRSLALAATVAACAALAPARRAPRHHTALRAEGLHGDQSCFLPLQQLDDLSRWPRLLRVAGVYPGLTADEVAAPPPPAPAPEAGSWNYEFPDAHGADYGVERNTARVFRARALWERHPRVERAPRDDRSSKNRPKRAENGRDRSL